MDGDKHGRRNGIVRPGLTMIIAVLMLCGRVWSEVYTSTAQLEHVFQVEKEVVSILDDYIRVTQLKLIQMQSYVDDYHRMANEDDVDTANNPLKAFQLVKRLAVDWQYLESEMRNYDWNTVLSVIKEKRSVAVMPQEADLQGAAFALIRLKNTYNLNVSELTRGIIQGLPTKSHLNARDCLYLGRNTMHLSLGTQSASLTQAIEWFEEAMMIANQEKNSTAGQQEIRPFLQEALQMHDQSYQSKQQDSTGLEDINLASNKKSSSVDQDRSRTPLSDVDKFDALCRGEKLRSAAYEAQLKCYYKTGPHPYLLLNKLKVEENHLHPPLLTLHDVIYDKEIELIKSIATPNLQRSTVVGTQGNWRVVSDTRTSQNTWLYMQTVQQHEMLMKLYKRLNIITGLKADDEQSAEALQVANYGVGGHYVPHYDYLFQLTPLDELVGADPNDLIMGDRMATLMFYLSDVSRGGATAFPKMGAAVWPKKGSAAFWFNLKQNGHGDSMTLHGACPVLHGSKWVANKWIRERSQILTRPCSLDETQ
ncbi:hypothetical protein CHUAL_008556 [Chamberlinius hualienensis]